MRRHGFMAPLSGRKQQRQQLTRIAVRQMLAPHALNFDLKKHKSLAGTLGWNLNNTAVEMCCIYLHGQPTEWNHRCARVNSTREIRRIQHALASSIQQTARHQIFCSYVETNLATMMFYYILIYFSAEDDCGGQSVQTKQQTSYEDFHLDMGLQGSNGVTPKDFQSKNVVFRSSRTKAWKLSLLPLEVSHPNSSKNPSRASQRYLK